jgi:hypothetical protein
MHSDFVVTLRKIGFKKSDFVHAEKMLFEQYCEIQKLLKRKALVQPKLIKEFAYNTLNEITVEENRIQEMAESAQKQISQCMDRKTEQNKLSDKDRKELTLHENGLSYFAEILTTIEDTKATLLEFLAAYYPEEILNNENVLAKVRTYLPVYNLYRKKIEGLVLNDYFQNGNEKTIPLQQLSVGEQAKQIIGKLNFEKACTIICDGLSTRMPKTLQRISKLKDLRADDRKAFDAFRGLSKEKTMAKLKDQILLKRDSLVTAYQNVLKTIEESSVDPEFTKQLTMKGIYENIVSHKEHFRTLRQYPSDWNNVELFGDLWGHHLLIEAWLKPKGRQNTEKVTQSLKELFYDSSVIEPCLDVLRTADPPLIDTSNTFVGNSKSALCVWMNEMKKTGIIKRANRTIYTTALNNYFKGFSMNESSFSKLSKKADLQYQKPFEKQFKKIKLSQSSQL